MFRSNYYYMKGTDSYLAEDIIGVSSSCDDTSVHKHAFIELVYFIGNVGTHYVGGKQIPVSNGHFCLLNANVEHYYRISKESDKGLRVKNLIFFPELLGGNVSADNFINDVYENFTGKKLSSRLDYICCPQDPDKEVLNLINILEQELLFKNDGYKIVATSLLKAILTIVFNRRQNNSQKSPLPVGTISVLDDILDYIEQHYSEELVLKDLANKVGYSTVHFNNIFKKYTGLTLRKYLQKLRCDKAKELLIYTKKSVTQIQESVGFSDPKQFFSLFKSHVGITPLKYRQDYLKNSKSSR